MRRFAYGSLLLMQHAGRTAGRGEKLPLPDYNKLPAKRGGVCYNKPARSKYQETEKQPEWRKNL